MQIRENYKTALFCSIFPLCFGWLLKRLGIMPLWYDIAAAVFFAAAVISLIIPAFGIYLHKKGAELGAFIGNIAAKIILFFVWILSVLPLGMLMKLTGRDRLRLKKPESKSYWIDNKTENTDWEYQF